MRVREQGRGASNPNIVLAFLLLAYIFNFLDRQILGILAGPIMKDLELNDAEFGAIAGIAFAILYSVLAIPLAMLADRTSRSKVIATSLAVWSGFTALCGTATGFGQLFLFRLGVGIGEASLSVGGRSIEGSGWLGNRVRWGDGAGPARVAVNLGVGEIAVTLD